MRHLPAALSVVFVMACTRTDDMDDTESPDDTGAPAASASPALVDANNYNFSGLLDIGSSELTAFTDGSIDWSTLSADFQGHGLDPATDVDQLALIVFRYLSQDDVMQALSTDTLQQSDISLYVQYLNTDDATSCMVSDFSLFGNDIDIQKYFTEEYGTWLLLLGEGLVPGQGTLMMSFVEPLLDGTQTAMSVTDSSTLLDFEVDLGSLSPVSVAASTPVDVDWSGLTLDGRGNELDLGDIDQLWVAHYPDASAADLQASFFDIDRMTDELWTADVVGMTDYDLADMDGPSTLSGLTPDGTWLLALRCSTCSNPAPPFLTVLDPQ